MDKVQAFLATVPDRLSQILLKQVAVQQCDDFFKKTEEEIKHYHKYGTFKVPNSSSTDLESTTSTVLTDNGNNLSRNVPRIKLERVSEMPQLSNQEALKENIKVEKLDMPPPQLPIKRTRKNNVETSINTTSTRSTRSKTSKKNDKSISAQSSRDSDVILEREVIETVAIVDSDDESKTDVGNKIMEENEPEVRVTRSKRIKNNANSKRSSKVSTNAEKDSKRSTSQTKQKKGSSKDEPTIGNENLGQTTEQAVKAMNKTYVANKKPESKVENGNLDQTHVIIKTTGTNETFTTTEPINFQDIMTDDEDDNNGVVVTLPKKIRKENGAKAIFSPFVDSPVKKKVEAFEKLGAETGSEIPIHMSRFRTKTKQDKEDKPGPTTPLKSTMQLKDKSTPQLANRYLSALSNSALKADRSISYKSASALKCSQQEFREREILRREKEQGAIKKRDALLQAQIEEKKRKHMEKEIKAQQTRDALQKMKLKSLEEAQRLKEEKRRQILAERQEKLKRQQEEAELRRLEVLKRAKEEKKEEAKRMANVKRTGTKEMPIYLRTQTPLLPTENCYDSDDDGYQHKTRKLAWAEGSPLRRHIQLMRSIESTIISNFFIMNATTPDLVDIFKYVDPKKLKRTSSANWNVPPRCTLMLPNGNQSIMERDEED